MPQRKTHARLPDSPTVLCSRGLTADGTDVLLRKGTWYRFLKAIECQKCQRHPAVKEAMRDALWKSQKLLREREIRNKYKKKNTPLGEQEIGGFIG